MKKNSRFEDLLASALMVTIFVLAATLLISFLGTTYDAAAHPSFAIGLNDKIGIIFGIWLLAVFLLAAKRVAPYLYGLIEVGLALGSAWVSLSFSFGPNRFANLVALLGCLFFATRGFSTMEEAKGRPLFDGREFKRQLWFKDRPEDA